MGSKQLKQAVNLNPSPLQKHKGETQKKGFINTTHIHRYLTAALAPQGHQPNYPGDRPLQPGGLHRYCKQYSNVYPVFSQSIFSPTHPQTKQTHTPPHPCALSWPWSAPLHWDYLGICTLAPEDQRQVLRTRAAHSLTRQQGLTISTVSLAH